MNVPRVLLLTTDTTHHRYFAWRLAQQFSLAAIMIETGAPVPPFETGHPFECERDAYERDVLLRGEPHPFGGIAPVTLVESVNANEAVAAARRVDPHVMVVFGTRRLTAAMRTLAPVACLNLHGGDPERYRGLDSHLWTIYHRDFDSLITTLHHVDDGLDTGAVVGQRRLPLARDTLLSQLRALNTRACVDLTCDALATIASGRQLAATAQRAIGRYYSFMPSVLKADCVSKFSRYAAAL